MSSHQFRVVPDDYSAVDMGHDAAASQSVSVADFRSVISPETVCVNAGEVLALMLHAARTNRAWLNDFADESIEISQDMYEVLLAYKRVAQAENARAA